jgi:hypothetical protein
VVPLTTSSVNENDHLSIGIVAAILSGDSHLTELDLAATDVLPSLKNSSGPT